MRISLSAGGSPAQAAQEVHKLLHVQIPDSSSSDALAVGEAVYGYITTLLEDLPETSGVNVAVSLTIQVDRV